MLPLTASRRSSSSRPPGRRPRPLPLADDLGDREHDLLAVAEDGRVEEVGDRLGVERRVAAGQHDRVLVAAVDRVQRDAGEVERVEHVGVAELGGEAQAEDVEVAHRAVRVDGELRDRALLVALAHDLLHVRPDGVGALGDDPVALVEHLVEDLRRPGWAGRPRRRRGTSAPSGPSASPSGAQSQSLTRRVQLAADVLDRLGDRRQPRLEAARRGSRRLVGPACSSAADTGNLSWGIGSPQEYVGAAVRDEPDGPRSRMPRTGPVAVAPGARRWGHAGDPRGRRLRRGGFPRRGRHRAGGGGPDRRRARPATGDLPADVAVREVRRNPAARAVRRARAPGGGRLPGWSRACRGRWTTGRGRGDRGLAGPPGRGRGDHRARPRGRVVPHAGPPRRGSGGRAPDRRGRAAGHDAGRALPLPRRGARRGRAASVRRSSSGSSTASTSSR